MKTIAFPPLFALFAISADATAEDIRPGLWKISLESRVAAAPDWRPQPFELTQCLTAADAEHPERLLTGAGGPGVSGCDFPGSQHSAGHLSFDVRCAGALGLSGHGEMSFTATSIDGTLDVSFGGEERTDMGNQLHAVYVGECAGGQGGMNPPMSQPERLPAEPPAE